LFDKITESKKNQSMQRPQFVQLGKGTYGDVFFDCTTGMALKRMVHTEAHSDGLSVTAMREARLLQMLAGHKNIMRLHDILFGDKVIFLTVEYLPYTLRQIMDTCRMCRRASGQMARDLFDGLAYCHAKGVVHRDIKPDNLLFDSGCRLKIADFGLAREELFDSTHDNDAHHYTPQMVTLWYRAPEILMNTPYGKNVDVWSAGCVVGEAFIGRPLFPGETEIGMLKLTTCEAIDVVKTMFDDDETHAMELVEACLSESSTRISAEAALSFPLLLDAFNYQ
tara:strand:- start:5440 stop:6279 length:840 start_codon:yes stop_codon:yes gene_type:complete